MDALKYFTLTKEQKFCHLFIKHCIASEFYTFNFHYKNANDSIHTTPLHHQKLSNCQNLIGISHYSKKKMKYTYKFLWTGKVEQLYHSKVITCDNVDARVRDTSTGYIRFIRVPRPDAHHLVPQDTTDNNTRYNTSLMSYM